MYTNKELANAFKILIEECRSNSECNSCRLHIRNGCSLVNFPSDSEIKELEERDEQAFKTTI